MIADQDHDLDRIMAVMAASFDPAFGEAWNRRQVTDALVMSHCRYRLFDAAAAPAPPDAPAAGFFLSRTGVDEEELLLFAVEPAKRGQGIGMAMLRQLARDAHDRGALRLLLEMRRGNSAERLYRSFGFFPVGERRKYYRLPDGGWLDAITFACPLPANM